MIRINANEVEKFVPLISINKILVKSSTKVIFLLKFDKTYKVKFYEQLTLFYKHLSYITNLLKQLKAKVTWPKSLEKLNKNKTQESDGLRQMLPSLGRCVSSNSNKQIATLHLIRTASSFKICLMEPYNRLLLINYA